MAMNGPSLGSEIKAALLSAEVAIDDPSVLAVWQAVAGAIVAHIQANGLVSTTVAPGQVVTTPDTINGTTTTPGVGTGNIT